MSPDNLEMQFEAELCPLGHGLSDLPNPVLKHGDLESNVCSLRIESLAPHKRLPPELLAEIFILCSPTTVVALPPKSDHPLLTLTRVCRAWRELALHIPELWASISVTFTEERKKVEQMTDLAFQWLSRAGNEYPLSITSVCAGTYAATTCGNPALVESFVSMVISHAHHLRHFDLGFPMAALLPLFELPLGTFPRLETMGLRPPLRSKDLDTTQTARWHWPSTSTTAFASAPLVREVKFCPQIISELENNIMDDILARATRPFFVPTFLLPWSQLRVLSFQLPALADVWCTILAECAELREFDAAVWPSLGYQRDLNSAPQICLHHLAVLQLGAHSGGCEELIDRLVAPSLSRLSIIQGRSFPAASLAAFQARSAFSLKFFIPSAPRPEDDVTVLFQQFSEIAVLAISSATTEQFPISFWERLGRGDLLPQLETLVVRPTAAQASVLVDMIASRWEAATEGRIPILDVIFCGVGPVDLAVINEELKRLEKYEAAGHMVSVF
ncbi:F-box domain-containing protein [Mycena sanguinolenta]|uniref:F-box domain-containing protein n=1 Tax=Mycena sanguinolenta TaxID=230812 RepID=A0A8H6XXM3_9AGAR|nr:F-box domain-containing protein [Mycena sanguinolenta]